MLIDDSCTGCIFPGSYSEKWREAAGDRCYSNFDSGVSLDQIKSAKEEILNHISFVHQHDEEFSNLKKERRAGRPASTREDVLKMKIAADEKEYENGFCEYLTSLNTPLANFF